MKIMRKDVLASLLSLVFFLGCATFQERGSEQRWETSATAVATVATYEALRERPDWRDEFIEARDALHAIALKDEIDFWVVFEIVNRLPIDELQGERAVVYATTATLLFEEFGNPSVDLRDVEGLRGFVRGLAVGIDRGMTLTNL